MGENSEISWTHHTFNAWEGCVKVSPACDNCYAARRDQWIHKGKHWGKDTPRLPHSDAYWKKPIQWNKDAIAAGERRQVFGGSLMDIMEDRPELNYHRVRLYNLIDDTPGLDWILLSKRPQNFRKLLPQAWMDRPRKNVWLMTTCETQEYAWRIVELLMTPALIHGISYEPALGPLNLRRVEASPKGGCGGPAFVDTLTGHCVTVGGCQTIPKLDWVIAGGESGDHPRAASPEWFRSVRDQCASTGTAFHFKQWGEWAPDEKGGSEGLKTYRDGHQLVQIGKKAAGHLLDGVEHRSFPQVRA